MTGRIPRYFDRNRTTKIRAAEGWIYVKPVGYGKFYVTATGMRAETFPAEDIYYAVTELANFLGGVVNECKSPTAIVDNLLETDEEFTPEEAEQAIQDVINPDRGKINSIKVIGRRWFNRTVGHTYHAVDIYVNGEFVHNVPFAYGHGDHYQQTAFDWLKENNYINSNRSNNESLWRACERLGIKFEQDVYDVRRKRDL